MIRLEPNWSKWLSASSSRSFDQYQQRTDLEVCGSVIHFAGPSDDLLSNVLSALTPITPQKLAEPDVKVIIAPWHDLRNGPDALTWSGTQPRVKQEKFTAQLELGGHAISFFNKQSKVWLWAVRDEKDPRWRLPEHIRPLISGHIEDAGFLPAHGGTLGDHSKAILITNRGGAGKSTLVAAGVIRGMQTTGDDFLALRGTREGLLSHNIFGSIKLAPSSPAWAEIPFAPSITPGSDKALVPLSSLEPSAIAPTQLLTAIVVPVVGEITEIGEIEPGGVMAALLPSSFGLARRGSEVVRGLATVTEGLPAYRLTVSTDLDGAINALENLLSR